VKGIKIYYICIYENSIMKATKHCLKKQGGRREEWECNGEGELLQGTLYPRMELPQ
jgi:hypothetical protein